MRDSGFTNSAVDWWRQAKTIMAGSARLVGVLATLVLADVEVVLMLVAPVPLFAAVVLGWLGVTRVLSSVGRVIPTSSLFR